MMAVFPRRATTAHFLADNVRCDLRDVRAGVERPAPATALDVVARARSE